MPESGGLAMTDDIAYFTRRMEEERERAGNATQPEIRRIHHELAVLYAEGLQRAQIAVGNASPRDSSRTASSPASTVPGRSANA